MILEKKETYFSIPLSQTTISKKNSNEGTHRWSASWVRHNSRKLKAQKSVDFEDLEDEDEGKS